MGRSSCGPAAIARRSTKQGGEATVRPAVERSIDGECCVVYYSVSEHVLVCWYALNGEECPHRGCEYSHAAQDVQQYTSGESARIEARMSRRRLPGDTPFPLSDRASIARYDEGQDVQHY